MSYNRHYKPIPAKDRHAIVRAFFARNELQITRMMEDIAFTEGTSPGWRSP